MTAPTIIDKKYEVIRQLGQGGMGAVYEARHTGTGRRVALKVIVAQALAQGADIITRFQREARASGSIESEHVVQVLDTGVDGTTGNPYMVMELLAGEDIQQLVRRVGPLAPDLALRLIAQACVGLKRAHDAGIIHRDIKSANLYIAHRDSGDAIVKILDFGIAKVRADPLTQAGDHGLTRTGSMIGSPLYMSPEQALGLKSLDLRGDIWSLGVVLYETLCGVTPNADCETIGQLLIAINSGKRQPLQERAPWVTPEIAQIVERTLAHEPADRFQSAAEMHAAIIPLLSQGTVLMQSMFGPMPPEMKTFIAPKLAHDVARADMSGQSPLASSIAVSSIASVAALSGQSTTGGFGASQAPAVVSRKSPLRWVLPLVGVALVGGTFAAYTKLTRSNTTTHAQNNDSASSQATSAAAPSATPVAMIGASRTVSLTIQPSDAHVDVDNVSASLNNGRLYITGDIGSVHKVHVTKTGIDRWQDVVIAETGAVPSTINAASSAPIVMQSTTSHVVSSPVASAPIQPAQPPPQTTKSHTSSTPTIDRSM